MRQIVRGIKDPWVMHRVQACLLNSARAGRRNYTIFQLGKCTLLRVSEVLRLKKSDVYAYDGTILTEAHIIDKKTHKPNDLYISPAEKDLEKYFTWMKDYQKKYPHSQMFDSIWLFPSAHNPSRHLSEREFYRVMSEVGRKLQIDYLGTHTMRKTGAYMVYQQSHFDIGLVMKLLNHSSEQQTLAYIGVEQEQRKKILDTIDFG